MSNSVAAYVDMTHTCGDRFRIPIAGKDLSRMSFSCPQCGETVGFTPEQIQAIEKMRDSEAA